MDISILRRDPADRIRTINLFDNDQETARVLYCGRDEMKRVREISAELQEKGMPADDAYNCAFGRVALVDWSGLNDGGQFLEVNDDNRDLLMLNSSEIRTQVLTAASSLKVAEKNS